MGDSMDSNKWPLLAIIMVGGCAPSIQEPAPICNMDAISQQRQLVAVPAAVPGQPSPLIEMPLNSVNITDFAVINKIWTRSINVRRTATGTVEVMTQFVNCTDFPLQLEARTQFYDSSRAPSEPVSAWKRVYLTPRTYNTYAETSLKTKDSQYYLVEVKEGR